MIGIGTKRIVYDLRNGNVLKIAKSKFGIKSNKKEVVLYKSSPYKIKQYLGKIIRYNSRYHWVIMKKYTRRIPKTRTYTNRLYRLKRKFKQYGITPYEMTYRRNNKPNYKNLRLKSNNMIVVVDFGNFKRISRRM